MKTKKRRKFSTNNRKHLERKQDPFLQFETLSHHKNGRIESHYENITLTRRRTNNIYVENHESDRIKLRNLRKEDVDHYLND